jgi:hypothetical protein
MWCTVRLRNKKRAFGNAVSKQATLNHRRKAFSPPHEVEAEGEDMYDSLLSSCDRIVLIVIGCVVSEMQGMSCVLPHCDITTAFPFNFMSALKCRFQRTRIFLI